MPFWITKHNPTVRHRFSRHVLKCMLPKREHLVKSMAVDDDGADSDSRGRCHVIPRRRGRHEKVAPITRGPRLCGLTRARPIAVRMVARVHTVLCALRGFLRVTIGAPWLCVCGTGDAVVENLTLINHPASSAGRIARILALDRERIKEAEDTLVRHAVARRKMGHFTMLVDGPVDDAAIARAKAAHAKLRWIP